MQRQTGDIIKFNNGLAVVQGQFGSFTEIFNLYGITEIYRLNQGINHQIKSVRITVSLWAPIRVQAKFQDLSFYKHISTFIV